MPDHQYGKLFVLSEVQEEEFWVREDDLYFENNNTGMSKESNSQFSPKTPITTMVV